MTMLTIDTLALANKLKKAGAEGKQAEAMAEAIATGVSGASGELATKTGLTALATKTDLANLEVRTMRHTYVVAAVIVAVVLLQPYLP